MANCRSKRAQQNAKNIRIADEVIFFVDTEDVIMSSHLQEVLCLRGRGQREEVVFVVVIR